MALLKQSILAIFSQGYSDSTSHVLDPCTVGKDGVSTDPLSITE